MSDEKKLTTTDKLGFFIGTILFLLMLPLTTLVSTLPVAFISQAIHNQVAILAVGILCVGIGAVITLVVSVIVGMIMSYTLREIDSYVGVKAFLNKVLKNQTQMETSRKVNIGALIGAVLGAVFFIIKGDIPVITITEKVEHLFPVPLLINLGENMSFNIAHVYAQVTGFFTIGFLFLIAGIVSGTIVAAVFERVATRPH